MSAFNLSWSKRWSFPSGPTILVALICLAEWVYFGFAGPIIKGVYADLKASGAAVDGPYPFVMALDWMRCVPVGILLAVGLILKDRRCSPPAALTTNFVALLVAVAFLGVWIWGAVPHRMLH